MFYVGSNMINNEIKGYNRLLLLAHAYSRFTSAESERPETRTYKYMSVPESSTAVYRLIINGIFVHCLYRQKHVVCWNLFWSTQFVNNYARNLNAIIS